MLRSKAQQYSFYHVNPDAIELAPDAFERHVPELVRRLFTDDDFEGMYHEQLGKEARCPYAVVAMQMLRFRYDLSEREVIERCKRDMGFKYALGLELDEAPPSASTLGRVWSKLCKKLGDDILHRRILRLAMGEGLLDDVALQAIDSTNTDCRGAVTDTYNLIGVAIGQLVRRVAQMLACQPATLVEQWKLPARYLDRSPKGDAGIDWNDEAARNQLLTAQVRDADRVVKAVEAMADELPTEVIEAVDLLKTVAHQDVEQLDDGSYKIARGTASGRVISITDPEARHGRKSASKRINGFKVHVMCTISSLFCTGVAMTDASVHDSKPTGKLLDQTEGNAVKPERVLGDGAYTTGENMAECEARGIEMRGKIPSPSTSTSLPKQRFTIDLDNMTATCPAGKTTDHVTNVKDPARGDGKVPKLHFNKKVCQACPLKERCSSDTRNGKGRKIVLNAHEGQLQKLREYNKSDEAPGQLRQRSAVERLISHLVRLGMRHARFFTIKRVQFQAYMTAAVYNLQRYMTLMYASGD